MFIILKSNCFQFICGFFYRSYLRNSTTSLLGRSLEITPTVPLIFRSVSHAIEWCVRSGQARNLDSARVSMPGSLYNKALCSYIMLAIADQTAKLNVRIFLREPMFSSSKLNF